MYSFLEVPSRARKLHHSGLATFPPLLGLKHSYLTVLWVPATSKEREKTKSGYFQRRAMEPQHSWAYPARQHLLALSSTGTLTIFPMSSRAFWEPEIGRISRSCEKNGDRSRIACRRLPLGSKNIASNADSILVPDSSFFQGKIS